MHGDEIRFDTERFQLLAPGQPLPVRKAQAPRAQRWPLLAALFLLAAAVTGAWLLF